MLENIREKYRKWSKKADEKNIENWQKHPRLNNWIYFIYASCMMGLATILLARVLLGYIQNQPILAVCVSVMLYGTTIWIVIEVNKIVKKAVPKQN